MRENTHIVIIINELLRGGAEKLVVDHLHFRNTEQFDYTLITLFTFPGKDTLHDRVPSEVPVFRFSFKNIHDVRSWWALWRTLRKIRPDVVISHMLFSNTISRVLRPLCGYAHITVEHNTYVSTKTHLQKLVDRLLAGLSYRIVAVSRTVADFTAKDEGIARDKFVVIHNGVDLRAIEEKLSQLPDRDALKQQLGFASKHKLLVNVARLTPQKNQHVLIEAFAEFVGEYPDYRLVILGEGGLRRTLEEAIAAHGLTEHAFLLGYQDPYPYYVAGEFLILTSDIEGFALVGIEAMACGMPVISTKTAGPDEYVHERVNGVFIHDTTIEATLAGMQRAAALDRSELSTHARQQAQHFDIRKTAAQYEQLATEALRG